MSRFFIDVLSAVMLYVVILSVIRLDIVMLSVVMLNVVAPLTKRSNKLDSLLPGKPFHRRVCIITLFPSIIVYICKLS